MAARYVTYDIFEEYKELTDRRVRSLLDMSLENLRRELKYEAQRQVLGTLGYVAIGGLLGVVFASLVMAAM